MKKLMNKKVTFTIGDIVCVVVMGSIWFAFSIYFWNAVANGAV